MKKEYVVLSTIGLFIFAYVLSYLAGPVNIQVSITPYSFLLDPSNFQRIPLTAFEILVRSIALLFSIALVFSLVEKKYFTKSIVIFVVGLLAQLYSIQQIMMNGKLTTMQWTLPIAYSGALCLLLVVYYIFQGIVHGINDKLIKKDNSQIYMNNLNQKDNESNTESILKPN